MRGSLFHGDLSISHGCCVKTSLVSRTLETGRKGLFRKQTQRKFLEESVEQVLGGKASFYSFVQETEDKPVSMATDQILC